MKKTLGGDRIGAGKKMKVYLHGYERSTHDLSYIWKNTQAPGTVVPFLGKVAMPGDTWDIYLKAFCNTHPTIGPVFGSFSLEAMIFETPMDLYMAKLYNNKTGIGLEMETAKFPIYRTIVPKWNPKENYNTSQINPSCLWHYLGHAGLGRHSLDTTVTRDFNAMLWLIYHDTIKNYYANKQEQVGYVIHTPKPTIINTVASIWIDASYTVDQYPLQTNVYPNPDSEIIINYPVLPSAVPDLNTIIFTLTDDRKVSAIELGYVIATSDGQTILQFNFAQYGNIGIKYWDYGVAQLPIQLYKYNLDQIDAMREYIMAQVTSPNAVQLDVAGIEPYSLMLTDNQDSIKYSQEGLALKCYKSDLFNNWLFTDWIDQINLSTAIDVSGGSFTQDQFLLSKKLYDLKNRIAVSDGSYDGWQDAVWAHQRYTRAKTPIFAGGLMQDIVFQEVISNSESQPGGNGGSQPLGTLAGKGRMADHSKGGKITVKTDVPSYVTGYISITPRLDYSQGNNWQIHLRTMDDIHKPAMDGLGFQDLIIEQLYWGDTYWDGTKWVQRSAGKQPAFVNYMSSVNEAHGNFAVGGSEDFMLLTRRYEFDQQEQEVKDLTTYVDPTKSAYIFAYTKLDAQNFWIQLGISITCRRKMSAKLMPSL